MRCTKLATTLSLLLASSGLAETIPSNSLIQFETAVARSDSEEAAAAYGALFDSRLPKDGTPQRDALLDAMVAQLYLMVGEPDSAVGYPTAFPDTASSPAARSGLLLAEAAFLRGEYADAERGFNRALVAGRS